MPILLLIQPIACLSHSEAGLINVHHLSGQLIDGAIRENEPLRALHSACLDAQGARLPGVTTHSPNAPRLIVPELVSHFVNDAAVQTLPDRPPHVINEEIDVTSPSVTPRDLKVAIDPTSIVCVAPTEEPNDAPVKPKEVLDITSPDQVSLSIP